MPFFDQVVSFPVPADAVQLAIALAVYPDALATSAQQRAVARVGTHLHVFQWTTEGGVTTLHYWLRADQPGTPEDLVDNADTYAARPAVIVTAEADDAAARLERIRARLAQLEPTAVRPPMPRPAPVGMLGLFLWSLIGGVGGVFVAAMNWKRLGFPRRFWPTALVGSVAYTALTIGLLRGLSVLTATALPAIVVSLPMGLLTGIVLVTWQRGAYRRWADTYGKPLLRDKHLRGGFIARMAGAYLVVGLSAGLVLVALGPLTLPTRAGRTLSVSQVSLFVPDTWHELNFFQKLQVACPRDAQRSCFLQLARRDNTAVLIALRIDNVGLQGSLAATEQNLIDAYIAQSPAKFLFDSPQLIKVDRHRAAMQTLREAGSLSTMKFYFIEETKTSYIFLVIINDAPSPTSDGEIAQMLDSLHLERGYDSAGAPPEFTLPLLTVTPKHADT